MINHPFELMISIEALQSQIDFMKKAEIACQESATEAFTSKDMDLQIIKHANSNLLTISVTVSIKKIISELIKMLKNVITTKLDTLAIKAGIHSEKCLDKQNVCQYIAVESKNILKIQKDITNEIKYLKNGSIAKRSNKRCEELREQLSEMSRNFDSWCKMSKEQPVTVESIREISKKYREFIAELEAAEREIEQLTKRLKDTDVDSDIMNNINSLSSALTLAINYHTRVANSLISSISPIKIPTVLNNQ